MYIYGGYDKHGFCCDDIHRFDLNLISWEKIRANIKFISIYHF